MSEQLPFAFAKLADFDLREKRVLVRVDFNVPVSGGRVLDSFRLEKALPTINYLRSKGAKVVLLSHLGSPAGRRQRAFSLKPVARKLNVLLNEKVLFSPACIGRRVKDKIRRLKPGQILLLENVRFYPGEESNSERFARRLRLLADIYVNEAFSVCHRAHASVERLAKLLPHYPGFDLEREVEVFWRILHNPRRPLAVVVGGSKLLSKIEAVVNLLKKADYVMLGGKVVNDILTVKGICPGRPWPEKAVVDKIVKINLTDPHLYLPVDVLAALEPDGSLYVRQTAPGSIRKEEEIYDIGPETIEKFKAILRQAKTILWAGPLGLVEQRLFSQGTTAIAMDIIANQDAFSVVGGGDTVPFLRQKGLLDGFTFVSTGGGAMLRFLSGKKMPGLEALRS